MASELRAWEPAPDLPLSAWASQYAMLPAGTSAEPGKWRPHAFQIDIMDAIAGDSVERVTIMKSRRIGYTRILCHTIGYSIHADPWRALSRLSPANQPTRAYALATRERQQVSSLLRPLFVGLTPSEFAGFLGRLPRIFREAASILSGLLRSLR